MKSSIRPEAFDGLSSKVKRLTIGEMCISEATASE